MGTFMNFTENLYLKAQNLLKLAEKNRFKVVTAESCTAGMISAMITEVPGSSAIYECGYIAYSNASKTDILGVPKHLITTHGSVSKEVVLSMAQGALLRSKADIAIAVTGIAGPGGGSDKKPVGLVYIACVSNYEEIVQENFFTGNRHEVREATAGHALDLLISIGENYVSRTNI